MVTQVHKESLSRQDEAIRLIRAAMPILLPHEEKRLRQIKNLLIDPLKLTGKLLLRAAEAFQEANRKSDLAKREFLQYCFSHRSIAGNYGHIVDKMKPVSPAALAVLKNYEGFDCVEIKRDGSLVFTYFTIKPDGSKEYSWEAIREFLTRDLEAVTETDYANFLRFIDLMNTTDKTDTTDKNGKIVPDAEALEKLIGCGFVWEVNVEPDEDKYMVVTCSYTITPVFQEVCVAYELKTDILTGLYASLLTGGKEEDPQRQALMADITKSALLMEMASTYAKIKAIIDRPGYEDKATAADAAKSFLRPSILFASEKGEYDKSSHNVYTIESGNNAIKVYEITEKHGPILDGNEQSVAQSMSKSKGNELAKRLGKESFKRISGAALKSIPGVIPGVNFLMLGADIVKINSDVKTTDKKVGEIIYDINLRNTLAAMQARVSLSIYQGAVSIHHVCVDELKLQIAVNAYNNNNSDKMDMAALINEFYGMSRTGEDSAVVGAFVEWYQDQKEGAVEEYRVKLAVNLSEYRDVYPECPYRTLEDLTPELINELDKKYTDPDYVLNLEGSP